MRQKCYRTLATDRVWLILYSLRLSHMGRDVGQIFPTARLHRDHSILYAFVCEKEISHPRGRNFNQGLGLQSLRLNSAPKSEISLSYMDRLMMDCFSPTCPRFFVET